MKRAIRLVVLLPLLLWAGLTESGLLQHRAIAGPVATAEALARGMGSGELLLDLVATAARVGSGVLIGLLVGGPIGIFVGLERDRAKQLEPGLDFLRAVPPLLLFPLLLLAFGYGETARVGVIAWAAALVISLHIAAGLASGGSTGSAASQRMRTLQAMGASRRQMLQWLHFYELLPAASTALRHGVATGLVVAVVTEMVVGVPQGLGARAVSAQIAYETPELYAVIVVTGGSGYLASRGLLALERRFLHWR